MYWLNRRSGEEEGHTLGRIAPLFLGVVGIKPIKPSQGQKRPPGFQGILCTGRQWWGQTETCLKV